LNPCTPRTVVPFLFGPAPLLTILLASVTQVILLFFISPFLSPLAIRKKMLFVGAGRSSEGLPRHRLLILADFLHSLVKASIPPLTFPNAFLFFKSVFLMARNRNS